MFWVELNITLKILKYNTHLSTIPFSNEKHDSKGFVSVLLHTIHKTTFFVRKNIRLLLGTTEFQKREMQLSEKSVDNFNRKRQDGCQIIASRLQCSRLLSFKKYFNFNFFYFATILGDYMTRNLG